METEKYTLRLYIAGKTQKSDKAIGNLEKYCAEELKDQYTVEIIDLLEHPHLAEGEQIVAVPTLIKSCRHRFVCWWAIFRIKAKCSSG